MELLQELEVWYVIPAIRREIALAMKSNNLKQVEIARRLGVTKAAVSQYLSGKRGSEVKLDSSIKEKINHIAANINNELDSVRYIQYLLNVSRNEKIICQIHRNFDKNLNKCNVCFELPEIKQNLIKIGEKNERNLSG